MNHAASRPFTASPAAAPILILGAGMNLGAVKLGLLPVG
jgi:hypothetical protein